MLDCAFWFSRSLKLGQTLTYKILSKHLIEGKLAAGEQIGIRIDQTLTQDATGTTAFLLYESIGAAKVKTDLSVSYIDHNMAGFGPENHNDHLYLQTIAAKCGVYHSRAGNGICHQVHLERFGKPAATLLGSDSHTPTGGGIGMLAIGAGGLNGCCGGYGRRAVLSEMPESFRSEAYGRTERLGGCQGCHSQTVEHSHNER
jgi:aconitate hydratase